ncbi:MAG: hypothetical protein A2231_01840 [Candidatus Firestonebacteria bacterium RIFOXYA2_FULL_40_8]|nr:MAG: hypothetical protein A2231_01840 [Candidatus Firestonebacteria bacterium RIFOXYA2_FULL_40_8]
MKKPTAKVKATLLYTAPSWKENSLSTVPPRLNYLAKHELSGDWVVPLQKSDNYTISYIQEGKAIIKIGKKRFKAEKGCIFIYKPHQIYGGESVKNYHYQTISIQVDFADEEFHHKAIKSGWKDINYFPPEDNWKMRKVLDVLVKEAEKKDKNPLLIKNYLMELFAVINEYIENKLKSKKGKKKGNSLMAETCLKAKAFMENNCGRRLLIRDIASEVSLSPFRFAHIFKEYAGVAPVEYLIKTRIDKAKKLLKTTEKTVSEIADASGFSDQNYFTRIFKKLEKITPSEYRASK